MKTLRSQKTIAAKVLKVGKNKIWFDPEKRKEIEEAITRQDMLDLFKDKAIKKLPDKGRKRRAGKRRDARRKKGRRRGTGKVRKKVKHRKKDYMIKIRGLRREINSLEKKKMLKKGDKKKYRRWAKSGLIKNRKELKKLVGEQNEKKS
ncbi:MAG: 50S ribosomal protein L19e [archaeon]